MSNPTCSAGVGSPTREASPPRGTLFVTRRYLSTKALLPLDRDLGDYVYRMADIVLVVAAVESRSVFGKI